MPLIRIADAFDRPEWIFALKHDGLDGGEAVLQWPSTVNQVSVLELDACLALVMKKLLFSVL